MSAQAAGPVTSRRAPTLLVLVLWLLHLVRRHHRTKPEPLPAAPAGSTTVLAVDGTRLHAQVGGLPDSDVTMVLVHGFLSRTIEFDMQWQHFDDKARLVRYDHRNHGRSARSRRAIDVETLADDLAEVIRQTTPRTKVVLVGHSMGGMTALALADRHPELFDERVAGVALVATGAGHYIDGHRWENLFRWLSRRHLLAAQLLLIRLLAPVLEQVRPRRSHLMRVATKKIMFGKADRDPATIAMTQDLLEGPPLSTMASLHGALLRHDKLHALDRLRTVPVLILTGSDDRVTRPEHSRRMAEDLGAAAELVVVPGAGHVVNQTRPTETNAALERLLLRVCA
ncbi:MAG TPA: alpha/beta hydrolase [Mycobacteriales bacterium]|nr:alpha/beta hydrolase [Mycobacteriales bacterium]